jgi:signal transduction histidine kinase
MKFRRPGEDPHHVRVTGETNDGNAVVRVEDDGIGIAPEHRKRIFRMFQRLHTRAEYPGTGIGLALCQRILDRHGGSIDVETAESGGARFIVRLPAAIKDGEADADQGDSG